jgi:urea transport system permease protein
VTLPGALFVVPRRGAIGQGPLRALRSLLLLLVLALAPLAAVAQSEDPFAGLTSESFDDVITAIGAVAVSGNPQAAPTIAALKSDALFVGADQAILIKTDAGYLNARTGKPVADINEDDLNPVRVNNAVRRAIDAALGSLNLFAADPTARLAAAGEVFTARNPAALPALARALAQERDPAVRTALAGARAAALLGSPDATEAERLAAVATIRARGDVAARSLLGSLSGQSPAVAAAAADAIAALARAEQLWSLAQSVFYGLSLGSVLLLAAAGLAITFGVMGVINMAHGEMVMIGAYVTFVVQQLVAAAAPGLMGASLLIAAPLAFLVAGTVGIAVERTLIRFLYGRPLETLLATWGLSLVLQQGVRSLFGANNREVTTPGWMSGATQWGGVTITYNRLAIIVFAVLVLAALMAVLRFTALGLAMRAVTQNRRMAAAMGIRTPWIDALTFGLGSGVAGMAGVALSQIDNVSPNLGQGYIIDSFMVVVFGGVGNLWGTLVSALTLGIVNKFLEPVAGAVLGKIVVLVLLILFIQRRPRGLFPVKGRAVEA